MRYVWIEEKRIGAGVLAQAGAPHRSDRPSGGAFREEQVRHLYRWGPYVIGGSPTIYGCSPATQTTGKKEDMMDITFSLFLDRDHYGGPSWIVKSTDWAGYPKHSVLAGQPIVSFKGAFETKEEALEKFPLASEDNGVGQNYYDHLPDEDDYSTRSRHDTWEDGE